MLLSINIGHTECTKGSHGSSLSRRPSVPVMTLCVVIPLSTNVRSVHPLNLSWTSAEVELDDTAAEPTADAEDGTTYGPET